MSRAGLPRTERRFSARVSGRATADKTERRILLRDVPRRGNPALVADFRSTVLGYWRKRGRHNLPWRQTTDPYKILVSEFMLQQTQVSRVIEKYKAFLEKFPTVSSLAKAQLSDVLRVWSGLGYNRRAKYLHDAAKAIMKKHAGKMPKEYEILRALPGVGDYTAKAVRVFAFDAREVLVETNVRTVFLHHFFPRAKKVDDKRLFPLVEAAHKGQDARTFYSALMDYGSFLKQMHPNPSRRSRHHVKQSKFEGSLRQVRGAILRAAARRIPLVSVRRAYREQFQEAFDSLVKDGLLKR